MSWFDKVTGSNDYERQSWRDSYNGGRAAGDLTGNVNARLDQERRDYQGATWSGSSSEYSALELARVMALPQTQQSATSGPGVAAAVTGGAGKGTSGPGSQVVTQGVAQAPGMARLAGTGPASRLVISTANRDTLTPKDQQLKRIGIGGQQESFGAISDIGWARTATGWVPVPSSDVKERLEDNLFMEMSWFTRNYLSPMFNIGGEATPPDFLDPQFSHYISGLNEWREGGAPRRNKDGGFTFTGGGF